MRKIISIIMIFVSAAMFAADKTTAVFTLDHLMHQSCKEKIIKNMRYEKGVSSIQVSLKDNTITIGYDPQKTDTKKLIQGFKKIGFNAEVVAAPEHSEPVLKDKNQ